jgi:hypothetical protein
MWSMWFGRNLRLAISSRRVLGMYLWGVRAWCVVWPHQHSTTQCPPLRRGASSGPALACAAMSCMCGAHNHAR